MNDKDKLKCVGVTIDDKVVVAGLFKLFDTHGLPFSIIFDICTQKNLMPSWPHLYNEAIAAGWKHETIINRLNDSITDVYGVEFAKVVISRLEDARSTTNRKDHT